MGRKWSLSSKLFGLLAVVLAVAAYLLVRGYAERVRALEPAARDPVQVLVADRDLSRGTTVDDEMVRTVSLPSAYAPPGALDRPARATGRVLLAGIAEGEPITETRVAPRDAGPIAALVPRGLRAFPVATSLPPGSVRAGDRVDVMATFAQEQARTETVASEVEVLLVLEPETPGGDVLVPLEGPGGGTSVVLLVTPAQAERLAYARAFADLTLSIAPGPET